MLQSDGRVAHRRLNDELAVRRKLIFNKVVIILRHGNSCLLSEQQHHNLSPAELNITSNKCMQGS